MGTGGDAADRAGSAEEQPATYMRTSSPVPPMCAEGRKLRGLGQSPRREWLLMEESDSHCRTAAKGYPKRTADTRGS
jgi:hypothetical protein